MRVTNNISLYMNEKYINQLTKHYGHSGEHKKFVENHYKENMSAEWHEYFKEEEKLNLAYSKVKTLFFNDLTNAEFTDLKDKYLEINNKDKNYFYIMLKDLKWEEVANELSKVREENR